jgi:ubiquinone/menaquinone biosynthesis C-methylase UbiE
MPKANGLSPNEQKYESPNPLQRLLIHRFQDGLCSLIPSREVQSVLDVGCGEGYLARAVHERFPCFEIHGIDASASAIERARKRCPEASFSQGRLEDLAGWDRRFDLVICSEVLEHLPNPLDSLRILARRSRYYALLTVPWEPWYQLANFARGMYLPTLGSHPEHLHKWSVRSFVDLVSTTIVPLSVTTRFPWTIYLGTPNRND